MSWTLIESSNALGSLLSDNRHRAMVAVDTEFRRRDTFFPQVALLQLCWGNEPYLIDPLQLDDLSALRAFLTDSSQTKLIHSASEDLEVFSHWLGVLPAPLFDTQRAAALVGLGAGRRGAELPRRGLRRAAPQAGRRAEGAALLLLPALLRGGRVLMGAMPS